MIATRSNAESAVHVLCRIPLHRDVVGQPDGPVNDSRMAADFRFPGGALQCLRMEKVGFRGLPTYCEKSGGMCDTQGEKVRVRKST